MSASFSAIVVSSAERNALMGIVLPEPWKVSTFSLCDILTPEGS
jgi:hypothetical protein